MKRAQTEPTVHIANFTKHPGPRYKRQGRGSGQEFRDKYLAPAFEQAVRNDERVLIVLTGTEFGCPIGFLEEVFGGLVPRYGLAKVQAHTTIESDETVPVDEVETLMKESGKWNP